ncbi:MAG: hypothetical protein D6731_17215 [Planctomycetota bacterium]|nr:MAG: hypothetical protein D6731_17215 [Planctomycetota bacterium]
MRTLRLSRGLHGLLLCFASSAAFAQGEEAWTPERAGKAFREKCAECHFAADPARPGDREWFDRLAVTA